MVGVFESQDTAKAFPHLCDTARDKPSLPKHRETGVTNIPSLPVPGVPERKPPQAPPCSLELGAVSNARRLPCPAPHSFLQHVMAQRRNKPSLAGAACRVAVHTMALRWRGIRKGWERLSLVSLGDWLPGTASGMGIEEKRRSAKP